jgi:hypothetical protein
MDMDESLHNDISTSIEKLSSKELARTETTSTAILGPLKDDLKIVSGETGDLATLLGDYLIKSSTRGRKCAVALGLASLVGLPYVCARTHLVQIPFRLTITPTFFSSLFSNYAKGNRYFRGSLVPNSSQRNNFYLPFFRELNGV